MYPSVNSREGVLYIPGTAALIVGILSHCHTLPFGIRDERAHIIPHH